MNRPSSPLTMLLSRRDVLTLLSGAAAGLPHELAAQPQPTAAGRLPVVGLLAIGRTDRQPSPPTRIVPSALAAATGHTVWQLVAGDFCGGGRSLLFGSVNVGKHNPVFIRGKADAFANVEIEASALATIPLVANGRINIGSSFTGAQPRRFITRRVTARSRQASSSRSASRRQCDVRDHATRAEPSVTRYRDQRQIRVPQGCPLTRALRRAC